MSKVKTFFAFSVLLERTREKEKEEERESVKWGKIKETECGRKRLIQRDYCTSDSLNLRSMQ